MGSVHGVLAAGRAEHDLDVDAVHHCERQSVVAEQNMDAKQAEDGEVAEQTVEGTFGELV